VRRGEFNSNTPLKSCCLFSFFLGTGFVIKEFNPKMLPEAEKVNEIMQKWSGTALEQKWNGPGME